MSIFELVMLICFGAAWPLSIYKSYTTKTNTGKSLLFLYVILVGYASGVTHKLFYSKDKIIYAYLVNALMVAVDITLYYRNQQLATVEADDERQTGAINFAEDEN